MCKDSNKFSIVMGMNRMKTIGHIQLYTNGDHYNPTEAMAELIEWEMQNQTSKY